MNQLSLVAKRRTVSGRKVKKLRRESILPANVYGKNVKSQAIQVELSSYRKLFKEAGETTLVELDIDGKKTPVLIHNTQVDPVTDVPIHVDFLQVNLKEKVTAKVSVELIGESPAEKQGLGTVVQYVDEIEVEALPTDLPERFEINVSTLAAVDEMVQIKNIKVDEKKVEIKDDKEQIIVKVEPPREEEVVVPEETPEGESVSEEAGEAKEEEGPQAETNTSTEETK